MEKQLTQRLTAVGIFALILACAEERSLGPQPLNFTLYVSINTYDETGGRFEKLYFLDADSLTVFDSLPVLLTAGAASPDGRSLYLERYYSGYPYIADTTIKLDQCSGKRIWTTTGVVGLHLVSNGTILVRRRRPPECATVIVSAESGATLREFDGDCLIGEAPISSDFIPLSASGGVDEAISLVDVKTGETSTPVLLKNPDGTPFRVTRMVLRPGGRQLLALGICGTASCMYAFGVFDVQSGESLLFSPLFEITGDIAVSADGRYAVVSNPNYAGSGPRFIDVFDLDSYDHVKRFDFDSGLHPRGFGDLLFLPDNRRVLVGPNEGGPLQVIDLNSMSLGSPFWLPPNLHPFPEVWTMFLGQRR